MKIGWIIIVIVTTVCLVVVIYTLVHKEKPRPGIVVEAPTVIIDPTQESTYPRPRIYPGAQQVRVSLETGQDCVDNCEPFEPTKGLSVRVTDFFVSASGEEVASFYRKTLVEQGWELNAQFSDNNYQIYKYKGDYAPGFLLSIVIERSSLATHVQITEQISQPFTWPDHN